jgi:hypothetical protein
VQFKNDKGEVISVENPMVRVFHEKNGTIIMDLDWFDLSELSASEYFANYSIDHSADYATYEVIYVGEYDDKVARIVESFRVIPSSTVYENVVKVYGNVNYSRVGEPIGVVSINIFNQDETEVVFDTTTKDNGYWESYIYPGEYTFVFSKIGFETVTNHVQIGLEHNELQFNNIVMDFENKINYGDGVYRVHDKYITREGMEIIGVNVKASSALNPVVVIAENQTDKNGEWELFLDPGTYFLKITGSFFDNCFDKKFRLKVSDDGNFSFQDLSTNVAVPKKDAEYISQGDGSITVSDVVIDGNGNPIVDVQVNVFKKGKLNEIIAQDYTSPSGKWEFYLNAGSYVFEFYHPQYDVITEEKIVK